MVSVICSAEVSGHVRSVIGVTCFDPVMATPVSVKNLAHDFRAVAMSPRRSRVRQQIRVESFASNVVGERRQWTKSDPQFIGFTASDFKHHPHPPLRR